MDQPTNETGTGTGSPTLDKQCKRVPFTRQLSCQLTEKELAERGHRAATLRGQVEGMEEKRDADKKLANAKIDEVLAEAKRCELEQRSGTTLRDVLCETRFVFKTRAVQEWRLDTKPPVMIDERAMTADEVEEELQTDLDFENKKRERAERDAKKNGAAAAGGKGGEASKADDGIVDNDYIEKAKAEAASSSNADGEEPAGPELETEGGRGRGGKPKGAGGKGRKGKR
jgi:hypothetical protein